MNKHKILDYIKTIATSINEDLRNYSNMKDADKPIVIAACLLAIKYKKEGIFSFDELKGESQTTDGEIIYNLIERELSKTSLIEDSIKTMMGSYSCIKDIKSINVIHSQLGITPLKEILLNIENNLIKFCDDNNVKEDYLSGLYSQFMYYSGADEHSLGIVLTPRFVTELFIALAKLKTGDIILDPCYGTGVFLISSLAELTNYGIDEATICRNNIYGYDIQPDMYTLMMSNLILRGGETEHIIYDNFLEVSSEDIKHNIRPTVGFMNPPYAQGKINVALSEICFVKHLLDSMSENGRCVVIVPASTFTDCPKTNEYKADIYKHHTIEGIITLNKDTFWGVGTMPIIAVFTAHKPHPLNKLVKFIDFQDDGYISQPHVGRIHTSDSDFRKEYLMKVWDDEIEAKEKFCIKTTVKQDDEWLYNFYHSNLNIPESTVFDEKVNKYLTFHCGMTFEGRAYLFENEPQTGEYKAISELHNKRWGVFMLGEDFVVAGAKKTNDKELIVGDDIPRVTTSTLNNAYEDFYSLYKKNGTRVKINKGNVVTIETATVGATFYQPSNFIANQHVMTIKLKDRDMNQYIGLFLAGCITNAIQKKYYYGYKFSKFRILRERILLPIKADGNIDYEYMEQYIKNIFVKKRVIYDTYRF